MIRKNSLKFYVISLLAVLSITLSANAATTVGSTGGVFSVTPTGQATYNVPIDIPPGINGMTPQVGVTYSSMGRNGPMGIGWSLTGFSAISHCNATYASDGYADGVDYDADDRYCLDGGKLKLIAGTYGAGGSLYRKEIDDHQTAQFYKPGYYFTVSTESGLVHTYGQSQQAKVSIRRCFYDECGQYGNPPSSGAVPLDPARWNIEKTCDLLGNCMTYYYFRETYTADPLPSAILYGDNSRIVVFKYSEPGVRPDMPAVYSTGVRSQVKRRLDAIETYIAASVATPDTNLTVANPSINGILVKRFKLSYDTTVQPYDQLRITRLRTIQECGYDNGTELCYPPTSLDYTAQGDPLAFSEFRAVPERKDYAGPASGDFNGDGLQDFYSHTQTRTTIAGYLADGSVISPQIISAIDNRANNCADHTVLGDFNADGYTDIILACSSGKHYVFINRSNYKASTFVFDMFEDLIPGLEPFQLGGKLVTGDFNGDAYTDVMHFPENLTSPVKLYYAKADAAGVRFEAAAAVGGIANTSIGFSRNPTVADFSGDGLPDLIINKTVYFNTGNNNFTQSIGLPYEDFSLGDFNGDGIVDIFTFHRANGAYQASRISTLFIAKGDNTFATSTDALKIEKDYNIAVGDLNGDGADDVIMYRGINNGEKADGQNRFYFSDGCRGPLNDPFNGDDIGCLISGTGANIFNTNFFEGASTVDINDYNGDGLADVYIDRTVGGLNPSHLIFFQQGYDTSDHTQPNTLNKITNGQGVETIVHYRPITSNVYTKEHTNGLGQYQNLQGSMYVVNVVEVDNGDDSGQVFGRNLTSYHYTGARMDNTGRGFLGFRKLTITDHSRGTTTETTYYQDFPRVGMPSLTEKKSGAGNFVSRIVARHAPIIL